MCLSVISMETNTVDASRMINKKNLGTTVRDMLTRAKAEQRLVCGLLPAITHLEKIPENVVFCLLPESRPGDATTHIQTVLLQAFCCENYIPVIQVGSRKKLAYLCGVSSKDQSGCNCAIVIRVTSITPQLQDNRDNPMAKTEQFLRDFYECTLDICSKPIIELPI